jgi:hypothetical protein
MPDEDDSPAKAGVAMLLSLCAFGAIPALPYIVYDALKDSNSDQHFMVSCGFTAAALPGLGAGACACSVRAVGVSRVAAVSVPEQLCAGGPRTLVEESGGRDCGIGA